MKQNSNQPSRIPDTQVFYVDAEENVTDVRARLERAPSHHVTFVVPSQTELRGHIAWRLLARSAKEYGREVSIVSESARVRALAKMVNFRVSQVLCG